MKTNKVLLGGCVSIVLLLLCIWIYIDVEIKSIEHQFKAADYACYEKREKLNAQQGDLSSRGEVIRGYEIFDASNLSLSFLNEAIPLSSDLAEMLTDEQRVFVQHCIGEVAINERIIPESTLVALNESECDEDDHVCIETENWRVIVRRSSKQLYLLSLKNYHDRHGQTVSLPEAVVIGSELLDKYDNKYKKSEEQMFDALTETDECYIFRFDGGIRVTLPRLQLEIDKIGGKIVKFRDGYYVPDSVPVSSIREEEAGRIALESLERSNYYNIYINNTSLVNYTEAAESGCAYRFAWRVSLASRPPRFFEFRKVAELNSIVEKNACAIIRCDLIIDMETGRVLDTKEF